jgi:hypothetical protein
MGLIFPLTFPATFDDPSPALIPLHPARSVSRASMELYAPTSSAEVQKQRELRRELAAAVGTSAGLATWVTILTGSHDDGLLVGFVCLLCWLRATGDWR